MGRRYAEVIITINPIGIERVEVIALEDVEDSAMTGLEMYNQLATAIDRWAKESDQILCDHWKEVQEKEQIEIISNDNS